MQEMSVSVGTYIGFPELFRKIYILYYDMLFHLSPDKVIQA